MAGKDCRQRGTMNLQTFRAATMVEALKDVKSAMGKDAIILHTRTIQSRRWLGLRRREMVEITAGKGMNIGSRARKAPSTITEVRNIAGTYSRAGVVAAPKPVPEAPRNAAEGSRQLLETPAAASAAMLSLSQEMGQLREMVKDLVCETRKTKAPEVPQDLFDYYLHLVQNEVAEELATDIVKTMQRTVRPERFGEEKYMKEKLAEQLEKLFPVSGPILRTKDKGPHVVALIGPTGVGKTTTLAKLAANLKLRDKRKVGLITLDTYRIAAIDQLKRYADIIDAPLHVVGGTDDLKTAMQAMQSCEYVLIDTAGRSPNDALKLKELKNLLEAAEPDEVHLVLSTTASQDCVDLAITKFSEVRVDKIIFTKIDEAAHVGVVLNVARKVNKSLSYFTTGQDVPDDIEVGQGKRLAQLILGTNG